MTSPKGRLGELMVGAGVLDAAALALALAEQRRSGGKLGEVLLRLALVSEAQLTDFLAQQLHLSSVDLSGAAPPEASVLARIPSEVARALTVLPLEYREAERCLVIAVAEPLRGERLERLREHARCWLLPRLASERALGEAITRAYGPQEADGETDPDTRVMRHPVTPHGAHDRVEAIIPSHPEVRALVALLVGKGLITPAELARHLEQVTGGAAQPADTNGSRSPASASPRHPSEANHLETSS